MGGRRFWVEPAPMLPHAMEEFLLDWARSLRGLDGFRDILKALESGDWSPPGTSQARYRLSPPQRAALKRRGAELLDDHQVLNPGPTVVDGVAYSTDRETFWAGLPGRPRGGG